MIIFISCMAHIIIVVDVLTNFLHTENEIIHFSSPEKHKIPVPHCSDEYLVVTVLHWVGQTLLNEWLLLFWCFSPLLSLLPKFDLTFLYTIHLSLYIFAFVSLTI